MSLLPLFRQCPPLPTLMLNARITRVGERSLREQRAGRAAGEKGSWETTIICTRETRVV